MADSSYSGRFRCCSGHAAACVGAPTAFLCTRPAQGMVRSMFFAHHGALLTYIGAETAQFLGQWGDPAHPTTGHPADIPAFSAKADTPFHQLRVTLVFHPNHVVAAFLANLRATKTCGDTVFPFLCQRSLILMHGAPPSPVVDQSWAMQRSTPPSVAASKSKQTRS